jgi:hypothetical protein
VNDFLAAGGDDFSVLASLASGEVGPSDSEALDAYLQLHNPAAPPEQPRLSRADLAGPQVCHPP